MLTRAQMTTADLVWLVSIEYAGQSWRWSTEPVTVTDDTGRALAFDGGLAALDVSEVLAVLTDTPDLLTVALDLIWPQDVAALIADGHDLSTATGTLSAWSRGTPYEDRAVLIAGRVVLPQYGAHGEPVRLSLEEQPYDDRALYPEPGRYVRKNAATGAIIDDQAFYYPMIWGNVGQLTTLDGTVEDTRGAPAIISGRDGTGEIDELLISGEPIASTTATIWWELSEIVIKGGLSFAAPGWYSEDLAVSYVTEKNQRTARVDLSSATTPGASISTDYYVSLSGGGVLKHGGTGAIGGLGDLALWWLAKTTLRIDWPRWYAVRDRLNAWQTAGYVNDEVAPWQWLQDNLLPLVPITVHSGAAGIYPVWWQYDATTRHAVQHIEVEPGIERVGLVEYDRAPSDIVNNLEIKYGLAADSGEYRGSARIVTGAELDPDDPEHHSTLHAEASVRRYGLVALETMTTDILYTEAAAAMTLRWRVLAESSAHRLISYEVPQTMLWLDLGAVVTLTDPELHISDQVALVSGRTITDTGRGVLTLQVITDPAHVNVTTGVTSWPPNDTPEVI